MSDDLVARLRSVVELWTRGRNTSVFIKGTVAAAADRIEELTVERDTLAEMVQRLGTYGEWQDGTWGLVAGKTWHSVTPEQAERFRAVLTQLQGGQTDESRTTTKGRDDDR